MKKVILTLIVLMQLLFGGLEEERENFSELEKIPVEEILAYMASETSKKLPMVLDKATKVIRIVNYKNELIYFKQVDLELEETKYIKTDLQESRKRLFNMDGNFICNDATLNYLIVHKGAVFKYRWQSLNHKKLFSYSVNKEDCLNFSQVK